jgi:type I restriction enzyme M protein
VASYSEEYNGAIIKMKSFTKLKQKYDDKYCNQAEFDCFLSEHLTLGKKTNVKNKAGKNNEEYYKWQFLYALVNSGMYAKDYIGTEIHFPKGNKSSAPIKFDAAIFDDIEWFDYYK